MRRINVGGGRYVGENDPCLIIVDAGVNHNNDPKRAFELIKKAAAAGVDMVKFQTYKASAITTKKAPRYWNQALDTDGGGTQYDTFSRIDELPKAAYKDMKKMCEDLGVVFCSTPFDLEAARDLDKLGMEVFKISSSDLTYLELLKLVGETGKPIILSTGTATIGEIDEALTTIYATGNKQVILQHCILSYPCKDEDANLAKMIKIQEVFADLPVGYSDHTLGTIIPIAAVAMGAKTIEKHYTVDKSLPDSPDHSLSVDPDELKDMVINIRRVEKSKGEYVNGCYEAEAKGKAYARKSVVTKLPVKKGTLIEREMLTCKRPGTGIYPRYIEQVVGRVAQVDIAEDEVLQWKMV